MRITLDLLQQAPQSLNPAKERQILLRGFKIPQIENLGGTNDAYECIDLSDNDLIKVSNFPPLSRLRVLLLVNNRISRIALDAFESLPNLASVVLTGNKLERLADLAPLTSIPKLERLSLLENPCTKVKHYRPYMIFKCAKTLRILDFNRIKDKERKAASLLFTGERGEKLIAEIAPPRLGKDAEKSVEAAKSGGPSTAAIERIKKAIADAQTIEEVTRLEKALKSGILPDDLKDPEEMEDQKEDEEMEDKKEGEEEDKNDEDKKEDEKVLEAAKPKAAPAAEPPAVSDAVAQAKAVATPKALPKAEAKADEKKDGMEVDE